MVETRTFDLKKIKTFEQQLADENKEKWELVEKIDVLNADIKALTELNGCTNADKTVTFEFIPFVRKELALIFYYQYYF